MSRVVVIGSANVDLTVRLPRLPKEGETVSGGELYKCFGGKGANQAVAALRAGAEVRFLAKLGKDATGRELRAHLEGMGLPGRYLLAHEGAATGTALILVDREGKNLIGVAPGANRSLSGEEVLFFEELFHWGKLLLCQLEIPMGAVKVALRMAKQNGMITLLNPAPFNDLSEETLQMVDVITPNQGEATALTGCQDAEAAARKLSRMGPSLVILTLGQRGVLCFREGEAIFFPSHEVKAVDTTGCGDAFNGALACALAEGKGVDEAVRFAVAAGALAATVKGAQDSMPSREKIIRLMKERPV
ncbi:MAG: ribokinase [bacterium]